MPFISKLQERFPDLEYRPIPKASDHPLFHYNGFQTEVITLPQGHIKSEGYRALTTPVLFERDTPIRVRDGVNLYADIFRPVTESVKVPAIIPWSPYGKTGTGEYKSLRSVKQRPFIQTGTRATELRLHGAIPRWYP